MIAIKEPIIAKCLFKLFKRFKLHFKTFAKHFVN